jgi:hypothetical protein
VTLPVSLVLIAIGAVLVWGVTTDAEGLNVDAIGVVLMVVGVLGFVLSLIFWDRWGWGAWRARGAYPEGGSYVRRRRVVDAAPAAPVERSRVVDEEVDEVAPPGPPPP